METLNTNFYVFISYSSKENNIANAVCHALEENNIKCWIAPRDITPGHSYAQDIIRGIGISSVFLLIFSKKSQESIWVKRELERAISRGLHVIPFRIEEIMPNEEMEFYISSSHWLDAYSEPLEKHIAQLVEVLNRINRQSVSSSPLPPAQFPLPTSQPPKNIPITYTGSNLIRLNFWKGFSQYLSENKTPFKIRTARPEHWYDVNSANKNAKISFIISVVDDFIRIDFYMPNNKGLYFRLEKNKEEIESNLGFKLEWHELPDAIASRIALKREFIDIKQAHNVKEAYKWFVEFGMKIYYEFEKYDKI
jgi:hypothetical protein